MEARAKMVSRGPEARGPVAGGGETLSFEEFIEVESLAALGRSVVDELMTAFAAKLDEAGLGLPDKKIQDAMYFEEMSRILRADRLPPDVKTKVEEMVETARLFMQEFRKQSEEDFAKRHRLFPLMKCEGGRALLSAVREAYSMDPSYPEGLTPEQTEVVGWILDYLRDYMLCKEDVEAGNLMKFEQEVSEKLEELKGEGLAVFAGGFTARMG